MSAHTNIAPDVQQPARVIPWTSIEFIVILMAVLTGSGALAALFSEVLSDSDSFAGSLHSSVMAQTSEFNPARQLLMLPAYAYAALYLFRHKKQTLGVMATIWPAIAITGMALLSTIWSVDPDATFRRSLNVVVSTMLAVYFILRYDPRSFYLLLGRCLLIAAAITLVAIAVNPGQAIHHDMHYPALRGLFSHKNNLGPVMAFAGMLGLLLMLSEKPRVLWLALLALGGGLAILSLSRSTWVMLTVLLCSLFPVLFVRRYQKFGFYGVIISLGIAVILTGATGLGDIADWTMGALGRESNMSGRTFIWDGVWRALHDSYFVFGYGFEAFWTSYKGALSLNWGMGRFIPTHAHNGWLQIMTHMGVVGALLFTYALYVGIKRSFKYAVRTPALLGAYSFIFLIAFTVSNLTEANILTRDPFLWILFVYASSALGDAGRQPITQERAR